MKKPIKKVEVTKEEIVKILVEAQYAVKTPPYVV